MAHVSIRYGQFASYVVRAHALFNDTWSLLLDLDNLVKFVLDALNGVAYGDDSQVATLTCAKTYTTSPDDTPRIDVYLRPLAEDEEPMTIIPTSNEESKKP